MVRHDTALSQNSVNVSQILEVSKDSSNKIINTKTMVTSKVRGNIG